MLRKKKKYSYNHIFFVWKIFYCENQAKFPIKFQNAKKNARIKLEKDFIALNREAVRAGLVTEREQMKFRNTHDIRVTNKQQKENQEHNIPDLVQKYFTSKFKNELVTSIMSSWPKPLSYSPENKYLELHVDLNF